VKRTGRVEPIGVVNTYMHGNNKLAKTPCFSYYLLCFFSTKLENRRAKQVLPRLGWGGVVGTSWRGDLEDRRVGG
jgi:hypothetical protein